MSGTAEQTAEDNRILREIISALKFANVDGVYDKHIAYLEKQKPSFRQIHDSIIWDSGLRTGIELEKQEEQKHYWKPTETDVALFNKAVTTNKALTPAERAQLDIIRSKFSCCHSVTCSGTMQKEQKPVEWDEYTKTNLDRALQIIKKAKGTLQGYQSDDGIYECDKAIEALEHFLYRGLEIEKPAEWSENESNLLDSIIEDYEKANRSFCGYDGKIGLLKAIRSGEYNLPKQE